MKCEDAKNYIYSFVFDGLKMSKETKEHVEKCPLCKEEFLNARLTKDALLKFSDLKPKEDFNKELFEKIREEKLKRKRSFSSLALVSCAVFIMASLMVSVKAPSGGSESKEPILNENSVILKESTRKNALDVPLDTPLKEEKSNTDAPPKSEEPKEEENEIKEESIMPISENEENIYWESFKEGESYVLPLYLEEEFEAYLQKEGKEYEKVKDEEVVIFTIK